MLCAPIDTRGCISITDPVPGGSDGKEYACNEGDLGSIPGLGRTPGGGHGNDSSIPAWRIPKDRGAQRATVHGVTKSRT